MNCTKLCSLGIFVFVALTLAWLRDQANAGPGPDKQKQSLAAGKDLFTREWLHGDRRSHGGEGLGPVFNARSCAACHHKGGLGGAGSNETNVTLVSAFVQLNDKNPDPAKPIKRPDLDKLAEIHPALRTGNSFPLHRYGADKKYFLWRIELLGDSFQSSPPFGISIKSSRPVDGLIVALITSERNAPALFGAGLIDRVPERVLEEVAAEQRKAAQSGCKDKAAAKANSAQSGILAGDRATLAPAGRVARLEDGRVGRFGWKSQAATLRDFTLQACSNELGLEVPGFHRAMPPWKEDHRAPGIDLTAEQCNQLTGFVASLPPPGRRTPEMPQHAAELAAGEKLFASVGCAACHRPKLGDIDGIYSDLLLHDMGPLLSDTGSYGSSTSIAEFNGRVEPLPMIGAIADSATRQKPPKFGAGRTEWRTPPLWGLHDSAPYLHDGRADTVADAVRFHYDGEGQVAAEGYFHLSLREREMVELFLQSLAAPVPPR